LLTRKIWRTYLSASNTQSKLSSTSKGKKKKKISTHEKNPDYPPKAYGHFVREMASKYYKKHFLGSFKWQFLNHGKDKLMSLQIDLVRKITKALAFLELYNNYNHDFWEYGRWLDQQIISSTLNIIHSFEYVYKRPKGGEWNPRDVHF
jgi:hypothetical protein